MPRARHFARDRLSGHVPDDLVDTVELCVSELATNCVLHAATEFAVRVCPVGDAVRVDVSDRSPVPPRQVPYGLVAATGRGLDLVTNLSSEWGVELSDDGKTVWCLISSERGREIDEDELLAAWGDLEDDEPLPVLPTSRQPSELRVVRLLGYPVRRGLRAREHSDALLRECMLLRSGAEPGRAYVPGRLVDLAMFMRSRYSAQLSGPERLKVEAFARGDETVDLEYTWVAGAEAVVEQWRGVLAEMDAFCRAEKLLTLATPPDVQELNDWVLTEFQRQAAGEAPRPWHGPLD